MVEKSGRHGKVRSGIAMLLGVAVIFTWPHGSQRPSGDVRSAATRQSQPVRVTGTRIKTAIRANARAARPGARRYVDPAGSDASAGTHLAPWRTLEHALAAARPGMTIVLRRGAYGARGESLVFGRSGTAAAPITIVGTGRPTLLGASVVSGAHIRLLRLVFDGPTGIMPDRGREENPLSVYGDDVEVGGSEIRHSRYHAGVYSEGRHLRLIANYIHDNGSFDDAAEANLDQGVYVGRGSALIADNLVAGNYAFGVQLYPSAHDVLVTHNTIVRNGRSGVIISGDSSRVVVENNIIAFNAQNGVRGFDVRQPGNRVESNLFWANGEGDLVGAAAFASVAGNLSANPRFRGAGDYHLRAGSPAVSRGRAGGRVTTDFDGNPRPARGRADLGAFELP